MCDGLGLHFLIFVKINAHFKRGQLIQKFSMVWCPRDKDVLAFQCVAALCIPKMQVSYIFFFKT